MTSLQRKSVIVLALLLCLSVNLSEQGTGNNQVEDDANPFVDIASALLQQTLQSGGGGAAGLSAMGGILSSLMQTEGGQQLGDMLAGNQGTGAADLLSGLSSLVGNSNSGFDPSMITNVIDMFSAGNSHENDIDGNDDHEKKGQSELGLDTFLTLASGLMGSEKKGSSAMDNVLGALPMIMNTIKSFTGPEALQRRDSHGSHTWMLPPFLEQAHIFWDHFIHSDLGKSLWSQSGLGNIFKAFLDSNGRFSFEKMFTLMENHSFRRRWIKSATTYVTNIIGYVADPDVQRRYMDTAQMVVNGFLKANGYHKSTHFDSRAPAESLTNLVNTVINRNFEMKVDSGVYIKPAAKYLKDLFKLGQSRGLFKKINSEQLSDTITDTLNLEIIEPLLKVHRVYRYVAKSPQCDKYVLCEINTHDPNEPQGLPGFKAGLTRISSIFASWFISFRTGTPFFTLYSAVSEQANCQMKYQIDCTDFHEAEALVTTEYAHSEL